ncbi:shikimate dehydrogenase family protein [Psychroserpens damuponensis]|uniref:shikimate dehydrogenase family protein n=1 Tax=Psychroserpens damuponensis TaxID=943936 RepID=UPI00058E1EEE|nr:shikimate dehydrogenase [Psychroserpens damuponensis]
MNRLGLIGKDISYSFSRGYFATKFEKQNLPFTYENFDLQHISEFKKLFTKPHNIVGFNVTIPYKEAIIPYLDSLSKKAKKIGAVNTITVDKKGKLKGYNTDCYGFKKSIKPYLKPYHKKALILGTGGASKAIAYTLKELDITFDYVSRTKKTGVKFTYETLTSEILQKYTFVINSTPIGTHPNVEDCPKIPYEGITDKHFLFDLVYNPSETKFLTIGKSKGAAICNGQKMLEYQAEKAWRIWDLTP